MTEKCQVINKGNTQLIRTPIDVATGPNDEIFVLDYGNPKIIVFKQDLTIERIIEFKEESEIRKPLGIAVHNHMIVVSDDSSNCVKLFSFQGVYQSSIRNTGRSKKDQLNRPYGLAFNSKGILYIVDSKNYRVQAIDTNHENLFCGEFGSRGSNPGQFKGCPGYIAVDRKDRIYVTDYYGNCINVYDGASHDFLHKIICKSAWAIAVTQDDCLLVSSNKVGTDRLCVFSPSHQIGYSHQLVTKLGSRGSDRGQFRRIYGIAVSKSSTVYVAEYGNSRIQVINT